MKVGFVGIGTMGWPMAANVLRGGHDLVVFDLAAGRAAHFVAEHGGGRAAETLADLAGVDAVVTMLPTGQIVREVLLGADGKGGLAQHLGRGCLVIDMSSSAPEGTRGRRRAGNRGRSSPSDRSTRRPRSRRRSRSG
jgi:3-hydroxyisobutyrate dehydrogenase